MKQVFQFSILALIFTSCGYPLTKTHESEECEGYYALMKRDWLKKKGYYQIKGNPAYLEQGDVRLKYFNELCLLKLPERKLRKVLGKPNRTRAIQGWSEYIYCLNEDCSNQFLIFLDTQKVVNNLWLNPLSIEKD